MKCQFVYRSDMGIFKSSIFAMAFIAMFVFTATSHAAKFLTPIPAVTFNTDSSCNGNTSPYSRDFNVSGIVGPIKDVRVKFISVTHARQADMDFLLEGPDGTRIVIMSDRGSISALNPVPNISFTVASDGTSPYTIPLSDGAVYPSSDLAPDNSEWTCAGFGLSGDYADTLTSFRNKPNANGTWKIWMIDDSFNVGGSIQQIELEIIPQLPAKPTNISDTSVDIDTATDIASGYTIEWNHPGTLVDHYRWCITMSAADCSGALKSGTVTGQTFVQTGSLAALAFGGRYYACVQAENSIGETEGVACSDGVRLQKSNSLLLDFGGFTINGGTSPGNVAPANIATFNVTDPTKVIQDVHVAIDNLSHTYLSDLSLMLEAPDGTRSIIFSERGASFSLSNGSLLVVDAAHGTSGAVPTSSFVENAFYTPAKGVLANPFTTIGINGSPDADLSVFNGKNAQGTWKLYMVDRTSGDGGAISNIAVYFETSTLPAPMNTVLPAVSGTAVEGQTISCSTGGWNSPLPLQYAYAWLRNEAPITGAVANTYTLVSTDAGSNIKCRVRATSASGSLDATSTSFGPVVAAPVVQTPVVDVCANLAGLQTAVPSGLIKVGADCLAKLKLSGMKFTPASAVIGAKVKPKLKIISSRSGKAVVRVAVITKGYVNKAGKCQAKPAKGIAKRCTLYTTLKVPIGSVNLKAGVNTLLLPNAFWNKLKAGSYRVTLSVVIGTEKTSVAANIVIKPKPRR